MCRAFELNAISLWATMNDDDGDNDRNWIKDRREKEINAFEKCNYV